MSTVKDPRPRLYLLTSGVLDKDYLFFIFGLGVFFPSIKLTTFAGDTQPGYLVATLLVCAMSGLRRIPRAALILSVPGLFAIVLAFMTASDLPTLIRAVVMYVSPVFIFMAGVALSKRNLLGRLAVTAGLLSIVVGIIQLLLGPDYFESLVAARTDERRGVTGLFVEPSYFGMVLVMLWAIIKCESQENARTGKITFVLLLSVIALTQSALAVVIAAFVGFIAVLARISPAKLFFVCFIVGLSPSFIFHLSENLTGVRLVEVFVYFLNNPLEIITIDASVNDRFFHIYLSFREAIANFFLPHGFNSFSGVIEAEQSTNPNYIFGEATNKIGSGIGAALFELGFIGLVYLTLILAYMRRAIESGKRELLVPLLAAMTVSLNAMSFAAPYLWLVLGAIHCRTSSRPNSGVGRNHFVS
ncbi:MAG: hypothetical protein FJ184_12615 [Gammaproteobacteria bacterium]|nr:hypothetical protein [Gammaproteobacteria bacterium]